MTWTDHSIVAKYDKPFLKLDGNTVDFPLNSSVEPLDRTGYPILSGAGFGDVERFDSFIPYVFSHSTRICS